tara:strand:- start:314 stop:646 length:333 start_codon:yes stop_codon:yes gene_type:complete
MIYDEKFEALTLDELIFIALGDVAKYGNIAAFTQLYKKPGSGAYDRVHFLHDITGYPVNIIIRMLNNNKNLQTQFTDWEELFDIELIENNELNKHKNIFQCSSYLSPMVH